MNPIQLAIRKLVERVNLTGGEAKEAMKQIMSGEATPAQIGAFLTALRMKGETVEEIAAFASVMREFAYRISPRIRDELVDTCGTGGDKIKTFNVSTAAAFVAAGAEVFIAKHGNRSVTSRAGSADVVEVLGIKLDLPPERVQRCIEEVGIGFLFAPQFHRAMGHAIGPRKEMGIRTVFNILGPLTNPARCSAQLVGVYDPSLTEKLAEVLARLGCKRAMVVSGVDGIDELSTLGETRVSEVRDGRVFTYTVSPEDFGIERTIPANIAGMDPERNARILLKILRGERGPRRDIVVLNAGAAITVSGKTEDLRDGIEMANEAIDSGKAYRKLLQLVEATGGDPQTIKTLEEGLDERAR